MGVSGITHRKAPSVLTLRSCSMNHTPRLSCGSVNLKALTQRLPIKFRVYMPPGFDLGSQDVVLSAEGESKGPWPGTIGPVGVIGVVILLMK